MQLARVIGTVVATVQYEGLEGVKFLIVQPLDRRQRPQGEPVVAADAVHMAGPGELVYVVGAREASQALRNTFVPVDHAIVGIVDAVAELSGGPGEQQRREAEPSG
ncbi:MAG: EutN/CcmL family microcompartment protein [Actinobacteria bacterium]|nr:EutN/CcmL family microcompartment protein [Actinomycetota bacterium]